MISGQIIQDFATALIIGPEGFFVDIGAGWGGAINPKVEFLSNTYFLEKEGSWSGIAIDYDENYVNRVKEHRSCTVVCEDLMKTNINKILEENKCPKIIDYLSMDVDNAQEKVFFEFDWDKWNCRFITLEHNLYYAVGPLLCEDHSEEFKEKIREFHRRSRERLASFGYELISENVTIAEYGPVEDWYINPKLFDKESYDWIKGSSNLTAKDIMNRATEYFDDDWAKGVLENSADPNAETDIRNWQEYLRYMKKTNARHK